MRKGKEIMETLGMDKIWMPVLEQSCMELIERQRDGEEGRAQTAEQYSRCMGANKRHRI